MTWEGIIGYMSWAACEHCTHSPMLEGGCEVDGPDSAEVVDDWVECLLFERREDEEEDADAPNPDQMTLAELGGETKP